MKKHALLQAKTLGDWAYLAIDKHFHKVLKHEEDVFKDRDPEALHQMRVGMRRLRSAVTGFAPALKLPKGASDRKIGKIAHRLGAVRDLDVLKENLENRYKPILPESEQKFLQIALEHLAKQRTQALRKVQSGQSHLTRYQSLKQTFQKWLKRPNYKELAQLPIEKVLPDLLLPPVSQLLLHPGWLVGEVETSDAPPLAKAEINNGQPSDPGMVEQLLAEQGEILHSLRKQTKRVRYQMELFADFYGTAYAGYLNHLQEIQSILGKFQDNAVLAEFMREVLDSDFPTRLPTLTSQLAQTNYQAWQEWQPLQQQYLNTQTRQAFHLAVLQPNAEPTEEES